MIQPSESDLCKSDLNSHHIVIDRSSILIHKKYAPQAGMSCRLCSRIRVRANRTTGEVEVEGSPELVTEWWERLWPEIAGSAVRRPTMSNSATERHGVAGSAAGSSEVPDVFGEYFNEYRSDVTDVDKMLIAGAFAQAKDPDRVFTTKNANQFLIDQNVKVTNASECVRRLIIAAIRIVSVYESGPTYL